MKLWTYLGKNVYIEFRDGSKSTGKVIDYDDEVDNASGEDSIMIEIESGISFDVDESEIKLIEIID
ncbi:TPA: LSM domain protein [Staphylococcus pseudintermedius]|uniref:LSM domain protein n=1 Tax=Staphylococcus pseudintermedius TaxID=283734 RepID=UPI000D72730C|nr:LSM domain protein [Staphylococcus pseudintermedius]EGQ3182500.1 LSM domain protein [Staphylococcus pseudintermedius]EGQ3239160.1 LSM domain protein [Staphylococcus pseudintermedius]EGQ4440187.1 LSM domain protein [Staphylococcus pseudintermedius]EHD5217660.1 LSM domain protein [Staphylococcus pseudintermedius]EIE3757366.1 LSM domain protein [Staphylococcus pseudintermedius]